ncbi:MAG: phage portal protein [Clostridia bacterium]|nr:phage portal protein [Clostridia bacterium]
MTNPFSRFKRSRDAPEEKRSTGKTVFLCSPEAWNLLCASGYKTLLSCPEVQMCIGVYADLIASMTIQQMENTEKGDVRVKDALSRKIDIEPHHDMTHQTWMSNIVRVMLSQGNQVTVPRYDRDGLLTDLDPVPPSRVSFVQEGDSYKVMISGVPFTPDEVLHFPVNPDPEQPYKGMGYTVALQDVVDTIQQANTTKKALMESPSPSLVIKVDGFDDDMKSTAGQDRLASKYLHASQNGKPWFVPAEAFTIEQIKPLTIADLAIKDNLELDKRSVAAIFGVPAFLVGVGQFDAAEFNWFVATRVMPLARIIEQELTRKLLISPKRYFRLNNRSLLNYNITEVVNAGKEMVDRMSLRRNEWRDWLGLAPDPDMEELLALENYIPADMLDKQKKLKGGGDDA